MRRILISDTAGVDVTAEQDDKVRLELSSQQAHVLFEWLHHFEEKLDKRTDMFSAEDIVLLKLQAQLETQLTVLFDPDYTDKLKRARKHVVESCYDRET